MEQADKFLSVLDNHKGILYKVAHSYCKHTEDRKDLVQQIIYHIWKSFDNYNPEFQYSTWIYRIALNVAISFYRKERSAAFHKVPYDESLEILAEVTADQKDEDNLHLLQQFILELKEMDKAIMLLYLDQKPYKEIAQIMGISESNVGTKVSRIKILLSQKFKNLS